MNKCPECNFYLGSAGHAKGCSWSGLSPVPSNPLLALRVRTLIAAREFNTAEANRELQCGDGWLCDHGQRDRELADEIDSLLGQVTIDPRTLQRIAAALSQHGEANLAATVAGWIDKANTRIADTGGAHAIKANTGGEH